MKTDINIFQIGFNKCGTSSLTHFFRKNKIGVQHWSRGKIAEDFFAAYDSNRKPFCEDHYDNVTALCDMEKTTAHQILEPYKKFEYIYKHYPESLYILNTRDMNNWIKSRMNQGFVGKYASALKLTGHPKSYKDKVTQYWRNEWIEHHSNVINFFKDKHNLLVYNIENDNPKKLCNFLHQSFKDINPHFYVQKRKTK